jgi:hypothetical protein
MKDLSGTGFLWGGQEVLDLKALRGFPNQRQFRRGQLAYTVGPSMVALQVIALHGTFSLSVG